MTNLTMQPTSMRNFVESFDFNKKDETIELMLLTFRLMSEQNLYITESALESYIEQLNKELDSLPLKPSLYAEIDGLAWETTKEYDNLFELKSNTQELLNACRIVIDEI
jgi:hypothetical protein